MYTTDRADVYIAVKTPDAAKVDDLFKQHRIDFSVDDDVTGPFGSDESLIVFFFSEVKHANMEQETALLMNNMIPFSMFHEEGNDFDSGWSHSRLMPDGTMSFTQYFGDGETVSISEVKMLLEEADTLEQAKKAFAELMQSQNYPDW